MKLKLTNLLAIAFFLITIIFNIFIPNNLAIAGTVKSNPTDTTKQAAQEVVKDTGVKQKFGKSENGKELLEQAQQKASENLDNLADKAKSQSDLPNSQQGFLKNLSDQS